MTVFHQPQPEDKPLFFAYLVCAVLSFSSTWVLSTGSPNPLMLRLVAVFTTALILALAENRRSGWFFWL
jgi:hypothetical protein